MQLFRKGFLREMVLVYAIRNAIACFIFTCKFELNSVESALQNRKLEEDVCRITGKA